MNYLTNISNQTKAVLADENTKTLTRSIYWKNYKDTNATVDMKKKVQEFFEYRYKIPSDELSKISKTNTENIVLKKHDKYKYHISMFSNVVWGNNIRETHNIFDSFIDWSVSTINYIKNRKDIKLYIKLHPAELY